MAKEKKSIWHRLRDRVKDKKLTPEQLLTEQIVQLEQKLGYRLPTLYREFLQSDPNPQPEENTFDVFQDHTEKNRLYSFTIRKYLRINPNGKDDLYFNFQKYLPKVPLPALMPIAFDQFRNITAISLLDGKIYFWDYNSKVQQQTSSGQAISEDTKVGDKLYFVANDFHRFETKLYRFKRFS